MTKSPKDAFLRTYPLC